MWRGVSQIQLKGVKFLLKTSSTTSTALDTHSPQGAPSWTTTASTQSHAYKAL